MTQIDELHDRITRALDRISQRVEGYEAPAAVAEPSGDPEAEAKLAEATAQLDELNKALEAAQADAKAAQIEANVAREAAAAEAEKTRFAQDEVENLKEQLAAQPAPAPEAEPALEAEPVLETATEVSAPEVAAPVDSAELDALREELEDEKIANAQLQERIAVLTERQAEAPAAPAPSEGAELSAQREAMAQLDADLQRLQQSNAALEETVTALREANAQGVGEPHLINKAMLAELENLRATRAAEAAETNVVLAAMEPLLADAATEGGV